MFAFSGDIGVTLIILGIILMVVAALVKEVGGLMSVGKIALIIGAVIFVVELLIGV
jgi:hypothetical protein